MNLFKAELKRILKLKTFWAILILLFTFLYSQMGYDMTIERPQADDASYGWTTTDDLAIIKDQALDQLLRSYIDNAYVTYPMGFYKLRVLDAQDQNTMAKLLSAMTNQTYESLLKLPDMANPSTLMTAMKNNPTLVHMAPSEFFNLMSRVDKLIGGGSSYSREEMFITFARVEMTYKQALENYDILINKDKITGGVGRYLNDYLGIYLSIFVCILTTFFWHKDNKGKLSDLIYVRARRSKTIVLSRSLGLMTAMVIMVMVLVTPYNILTIVHNGPGGLGLFRMYGISLLWQLPPIAVTVALTTMITLLTSKPLAVPLSFLAWFFALMVSSNQLIGKIGMHLNFRHNSLYDRDLFYDQWSLIGINRCFWLLVACGLTLGNIYIYSKKRQGHLPYAKN